ncbi:PilZ domain-containing protein [Marinicella sp. W31]|uniref:PilZ domain-containing protein n=1 Tax=Marinicella sp. W31 TaxID=3023713 RepID=UPI0037566A34
MIELMNSETRRNLRVNPPSGSTINNVLNNQPLGELLNISHDGFMISSRDRIESGQIYQLNLHLTTDPAVQISIGAECMWTETHGSGMDFGGFFILDISDSDQKQLDRVIEILDN